MGIKNLHGIALLGVYSGDNQGLLDKHLIGYFLIAARISIARNCKAAKGLNVQKQYNVM